MTPARCWKVKEGGHPAAMWEKLPTEAPVNGGRNYNGPKVGITLALVKFGYMLENPSYLILLGARPALQ